jgi:hypothetical protein
MNQDAAELVETPTALSVLLKAGIRKEGCGRCYVSISFRSEIVQDYHYLFLLLNDMNVLQPTVLKQDYLFLSRTNVHVDFSISLYALFDRESLTENEFCA